MRNPLFALVLTLAALRRSSLLELACKLGRILDEVHTAEAYEDCQIVEEHFSSLGCPDFIKTCPISWNSLGQLYSSLETRITKEWCFWYTGNRFVASWILTRTNWFWSISNRIFLNRKSLPVVKCSPIWYAPSPNWEWLKPSHSRWSDWTSFSGAPYSKFRRLRL